MRTSGTTNRWTAAFCSTRTYRSPLRRLRTPPIARGARPRIRSGDSRSSKSQSSAHAGSAGSPQRWHDALDPIPRSPPSGCSDPLVDRGQDRLVVLIAGPCTIRGLRRPRQVRSKGRDVSPTSVRSTGRVVRADSCSAVTSSMVSVRVWKPCGLCGGTTITSPTLQVLRSSPTRTISSPRRTISSPRRTTRTSSPPCRCTCRNRRQATGRR